MMAHLLLNTIALEPNRWTDEKVPFYSLDELLRPIADTGFRFVELWQYHLSRARPAAVRTFRTMADDLGLQVPVVGWYPALHLRGQARHQQLDDACQLFDAARQMGADVVKLFVGDQASDALSDAAYQRSVECMQQFAEEAAARTLTLTGETHVHTLFDRVASCQQFRAAVGAANFKICYQPYDFQDTQRAIEDYVTLSEHVVHVHYQGRRNDTFAPLETADLDFDALTGTLAAHPFEGYLCIEFVEGCVVDDPAHFDLDRVLASAHRDRAFVHAAAERHDLPMLG